MGETMGKNYRSLEWKTAVCLVFSVMLHAGLIYYVALTQFSGGSSGVNQAGEISTVEFQTADLSPAVPTPISTPTETPVVEKPIQKSAEPKIEVTRPEPKVEKVKLEKLPAPIPKVTRTLPKKIVAEPVQEESKVEVAKIDQPEPQIEKEELPPIPPVQIHSMDVEKEVAHEKAVREELVEKIMKDEPLPEEPKSPTAAPAAEPIPVVTPTTPAQAAESKPTPEIVTEKLSDVSTKSAANQPAALTGPAGNKIASNLPVKNEFELKAMPGNRNPDYPSADRLANRQGEVKFMAEVTPEGTISNIRILKSSGHRTLDLAAYSAFKNYRYFPGQPSYVVKSFVFTLKGPTQTLPSRLGSRQKQNS